MKDNKTVFDFLGQTLTVFGFTMLTLNIFCIFFGNSAKGYSSIFELGSQGVSVKTAFQFLFVSVLISGTKLIFFTDVIIKKMPIWLRTACMLIIVIIIMSAFITLFKWFPVNQWQPWAMFFICFGISFVGSWLVMITKEKTENKKMEEALRRLKETEDNTK